MANAAGEMFYDSSILISLMRGSLFTKETNGSDENTDVSYLEGGPLKLGC